MRNSLTASASFYGLFQIPFTGMIDPETGVDLFA